MSEHPNVGRMNRYLAAWASPDPNDLLVLCSPDVTMHVGGSHALSGTYRGHEGAAELHRRTQAATDQSFDFRLDDVLADDGYAVAVMILSLHHGGRMLEGTTIGAVKMDSDGRVTEAWYLMSDQQAERDYFDGPDAPLSAELR